VNLLETSPRANDRRLNALVVVSVFLAVAVVIGALVLGPKIRSTASTSKALERSSELAGCRAGYRVKIDDAVAHLQASKARLDTLTNRGLEASVREDVTELTAIIPLLAPARDEVERFAAELEDATDLYSVRLTLSREKPGDFLKLCRTEAP
jgi:hypothetical protein